MSFGHWLACNRRGSVHVTAMRAAASKQATQRASRHSLCSTAFCLDAMPLQQRYNASSIEGGIFGTDSSASQGPPGRGVTGSSIEASPAAAA